MAVALGSSVAGAALLSGCAAPLTRRPPTEPIVEGEAGSWAMVMHTPGVASAFADVDPRRLTEFSRNDRSLSVRTFGPVTASGQWPEPSRASLSSPRRVYLNPRADTVLFFESDASDGRPWRSFYGRSGYPVDGAWGGWR